MFHPVYKIDKFILIEIYLIYVTVTNLCMCKEYKDLPFMLLFDFSNFKDNIGSFNFHTLCIIKENILNFSTIGVIKENIFNMFAKFWNNLPMNICISYSYLKKC